jgi:hypothetical protein
MRTRWFLWLVAVLIGSVLAFPPMISAAEKAAEKKAEKKAAQPCAPAAMEKKAPEKAKAISATGDVVSADAKTGMLAVKVKDKEMSFTAESKTAKQSLEKVKAGDKVTVSYTEKDGKMIASSVKAVKAPAKKAETKKEEKKEEKKK